MDKPGNDKPSLLAAAARGAALGLLAFVAVFAASCLVAWAVIVLLVGRVELGWPTFGAGSLMAAIIFVVLGAVRAVLKARTGPPPS